jgi:hypothetical protein
MNVEIGTEAVQFPEKEHINVIFFAVHLLPPFPVRKFSLFFSAFLCVASQAY